MLTLTPDERALLAGILVEPESDAPRLVFADRLQENAGTVECPICTGLGFNRGPFNNGCIKCRGSFVVSDGRQEWAEFIRLQVRDIPEHYRRRPEVGGVTTAMVHPLTTWRNELDELRRREAKIWAAVRPLFGYEIKSYWLGHASVKAEVFPLAIVRRGFPAVVRGSLESLRGTRCGGCRGTGMSERECQGVTGDDGGCHLCHGIGRVGGVLMGLVESQPVERVEVTDKRPWENSLNGPIRFTWLTTELVEARTAGNRDRLPPALFELLHPSADYRGIVQAGFDSEAAALAALSAALLAESRDDAAKCASVLT